MFELEVSKFVGKYYLIQKMNLAKNLQCVVGPMYADECTDGNEKYNFHCSLASGSDISDI